MYNYTILLEFIYNYSRLTQKLFMKIKILKIPLKEEYKIVFY